MEQLKVVVVDMQPIDPPVGGGRLRLLGLYSGFLNNIDATYVGSYDWRGPGYRKHKLSDCLTEINIPLSEKHFIAHDKLSMELGKSCIDTAFPIQGHLSKEFIENVCDEVKQAQVVIFSHPWLFPFVAKVLQPNKQLIIYDSHNCEGMLRVKLYDDGTKLAEQICREAVRSECELCRVADIIFACSTEDKNNFVRLYEVSSNKIMIVPNGVFTRKILPCEKQEKERIKEKLGLKRPTICFIGSGYYPNEEAARFIVEVAQELTQYDFIIIGGVGNSLKDISNEKYENVIITGFVEEDEKIDYLHVSDIAINPMLSGSGTNIKMFDFMAAGLPVITTDIGARGIKNTNGTIYKLCEKTVESLKNNIIVLMENKAITNQLAIEGRKEVCEKYSWEQISYELGYKLVQNYRRKVKNESPYFTIVIPSYERHDLLEKLLLNISKQSYQDFEIIIVDQSKENFKGLDRYSDLDITYFKTEIKGASKARNTGIRLAKGLVVAFIDDDCIPSLKWLENAKKYLQEDNVIGVEGLIRADIYDNEKYRVVNNIGFEGIGFMTANLFIKRDILEKINGFDEEFDNPHFREDTDLGWRALKYGKIPYADNVEVLHPSHPRNNERESEDERNKFFVHDPLLLKKHPQKFVELFYAEKHYKEESYWKYFELGMQRHRIDSKLLNNILDDVRCDKIGIRTIVEKMKN